MFALTECEPASNFLEIKSKKSGNAVSKMVSKAVLAASVMLATQLEAKEKDAEKPTSLDDIKTGSLGYSDTSNLSDTDGAINAVDTILGSAQSEVASLATQASASSPTSATNPSAASSFTNTTGLPQNFVTQSQGVNDPSQSTNAINPSIASFERGQTNLNSNVGSGSSNIEVIKGLNGAAGQDGSNGVDGNHGQDGHNGIDGQNGTDGANGFNGQDGRDGLDGNDGQNGLSTIYLDASIFKGTPILETLKENGFYVSEGPLGTVIIAFDPARAEELSNLLDELEAADTSSEPEHGKTSDVGTPDDDFLSGDENDNVISGFGGDDHLSGGTGADILLGGDGIDTADYRYSQDAVHVNLSTRDALFGDAEGDILVSIENLAGSAGDDILTGDNSDNRLTGRKGNDRLSGGDGNDRLVGGEGADRFDGGAGNRDAADFNLAQEAVGVDLLNGGFMGEALGDSYTGIEFIVGSDYHDVLLANNDANRINGGEGCDVINGRGGNDTLIGGEGSDVLNGGEGADVFIFEENSGYDIIEDFEAGVGRTDRVWLHDQEFDDFEDIQDAMTQTDDGVILELDSGSILFQDLALADFHADDFILA